MTFFDEGRKGATFEDGIEFALRFILANPQFLVRAEREPVAARAGQAYRISDLELASRLSFFLWSSIPDEELITVAGQGRLSQPARARAAGAPDARRSALGRAGVELRAAVAVSAQPAGDLA